MLVTVLQITFTVRDVVFHRGQLSIRANSYPNCRIIVYSIVWSHLVHNFSPKAMPKVPVQAVLTCFSAASRIPKHRPLVNETLVVTILSPKSHPYPVSLADLASLYCPAAVPLAELRALCGISFAVVGVSRDPWQPFLERPQLAV